MCVERRAESGDRESEGERVGGVIYVQYNYGAAPLTTHSDGRTALLPGEINGGLEGRLRDSFAGQNVRPSPNAPYS